jgi:peroxiredoxin Q/BCP
MELLRDRSADFEAAGVRVFGVSRDSPWTHIAWTQALDLNFPLVSDWNADAIQGFGIAREFRGYQDVAVGQNEQTSRIDEPGRKRCRREARGYLRHLPAIRDN